MLSVQVPSQAKHHKYMPDNYGGLLLAIRPDMVHGNELRSLCCEWVLETQHQAHHQAAPNSSKLWLSQRQKLHNHRRAEHKSTLLTSSALFTSAPAARSCSNTAVRPYSMAYKRAVLPFCWRLHRQTKTIHEKDRNVQTNIRLCAMAEECSGDHHTALPGDLKRPTCAGPLFSVPKQHALACGAEQAWNQESLKEGIK